MWYIGLGCPVSIPFSRKTKKLLTQSGREVRGRNKLAAQTGYTSAVDMWSLGCLITALLSGASIFVDIEDPSFGHDSATAILKASATCDLSRMETGVVWKDVLPQAKDLVRQLLQLNEKARLSADEALQHAWFIEGDRKPFFEEAYRQAIKGWTRTTPGWDYFEDLNALMETSKQKAGDVGRLRNPLYSLSLGFLLLTPPLTAEFLT